MKKIREVDSYPDKIRSPRYRDDDELISKRTRDVDPYYKEKTHSPRYRDDEEFIIKSKLNRNMSASNTSLNNGSKSARFSSNSIISRKSLADMPEPKSAYGSIAHGVRKIVPQELACKIGCRGAKCKYDSSNWPADQMAIHGIYSHWITDEILAMARPRTTLIKNGNLIHNMKKAEIRSIFNLQSRNEHKDCGDGIEKESGFSYNPVDFTQEGIYYYNFELEDYSATNLAKILDMVKVFAFALSEGKVAIHCHAGLGRTGFFIGCYLIYAERMTTKEAIYLIREKRPGSIQMNEQINSMMSFEKYINPLRTIFPRALEANDRVQSSIPNGDVDNKEANETQNLSFNLNTFLYRQKLVLHGVERKKLKYIPKIIYECGEQLRKLAFKWKADDVDSKELKRIQKFSNQFSKDIIENTKYNTSYSLELTPNVLIAKALATSHFSKKVIKKVSYYETIINEEKNGFDELKNEEDPLVLTALLWTWLDNLREPILRDQEINILLKNYPTKLSKVAIDSQLKFEDFQKTLINWKDIDKGTLHTTNYLIGIVGELLPLESSLEDDVISKIISFLTQSRLEFGEYDFESEFDGKVSLLNTSNRMKSKRYAILHKLFKELIGKPFVLSDKTLGKSQFKKNVTYNELADYAEEVNDEYEYSQRRLSRSHVRDKDY